MKTNDISIEDRDRLRQIYQQVKETEVQLSSLPALELLFEESLQISLKYGIDNELYISLEQTRRDYLIPSQALSPRSRNIIGVIADFKLFFLGDLLGWF